MKHEFDDKKGKYMKVKDLKLQISKLDDDMEICVYNNMGGLYEPIESVTIDKVRKHEDCFAEESGEKLIDSYKNKFVKQPTLKVATINY